MNVNNINSKINFNNNNNNNEESLPTFDSIRNTINEYSSFYNKDNKRKFDKRVIELKSITKLGNRQLVKIKINLSNDERFAEDEIFANHYLIKEISKIFNELGSYFDPSEVILEIEDIDLSGSAVSGGNFIKQIRSDDKFNYITENLKCLKISETNTSHKIIKISEKCLPNTVIDLYCCEPDSSSNNNNVLPNFVGPNQGNIGMVKDALDRLQQKPGSKNLDRLINVIDPIAPFPFETGAFTDFVPQVVLKDIEDFDEISKTLSELEDKVGLGKIFVDHENEQIYFGYSIEILENLVESSDLEILRDYFWNGNRSYSDGYMMLKGSIDFPEESKQTHNPLIDKRIKEKFLNNSARFFHNPTLHATNFDKLVLDDQEILFRAYSNNQGLIVGESHNDEAPKSFIIDNMKHLSQLGVKTLFVEFLEYDSFQEELDRYLNSKSDKIPLSLSSRISALDQMFGLNGKAGSYRNLIVAAKKQGIRIVGIDLSFITRCASGRHIPNSQLQQRLEEMNYAAHRIINKEKNGENFIVLTGFAHAVSTEVENQFDKIVRLYDLELIGDEEDEDLEGIKVQVPGLNAILGSPVVFPNPNYLEKVDNGVSYIRNTEPKVQVVVGDDNYHDLSFMDDEQKAKYFVYLGNNGWTNIYGETLNIDQWVENSEDHQTIMGPLGQSRKKILQKTLEDFYDSEGINYQLDFNF